MATAPGKFGALTRADAELEDAAVTDKLPAAADDACVGQLGAEVVVPQVGMSIQMDHM